MKASILCVLLVPIAIHYELPEAGAMLVCSFMFLINVKESRN